MNRDEIARLGLAPHSDTFPGSVSVPPSQGREPGRAEAFAEALAKSVSPAEPPRPRKQLSWEVIPAVKEFAASRSSADVSASRPAADGPAPRPASPSATSGSVFEASFPSPWLSDLLSNDTRPSPEPLTIFDEFPPVELGGRKDGGLSGTSMATPDTSRAGGDTFPTQLVQPGIPVGGEDARRQSSATLGVAPPLFEQFSDLWSRDSPGSPSGGPQPTAPGYPAQDTTAEERPYHASLPVGLPDLGTRNDGMWFRPVATGLSEGASEPDPYVVDLDPSSSASNAFVPVLTGTSSLSVGGESSAPGEWHGGEAAEPSPPKVDLSSGQADASRDYQGGGQSFDLSRTNELLQQLLDEVRRGGQGFLPVQGRDQNGL